MHTSPFLLLHAHTLVRPAESRVHAHILCGAVTCAFDIVVRDTCKIFVKKYFFWPRAFGTPEFGSSGVDFIGQRPGVFFEIIAIRCFFKELGRAKMTPHFRNKSLSF